MSIQSRLAALERVAAQRARQQTERDEFCGVIPFPDMDGNVYMCWEIPCDHVPKWEEFGSFGRRRDTCPDADICEYAPICHAGKGRTQTSKEGSGALDQPKG